MAIAKRIFFFILVNILVMISVSVITSLVCMFLYGQPFPPSGSITPLVVWATVWGMGGAVISLFLSKFMAKRMYGLTMITDQTRDSQARQIRDVVHNLARKAKLKKMPEVGIYDSPEMNAFATGPSRSNSLVAVSSGLVRSMNSQQLEGVLGHEIAHIANGDMVTLTLIQGVVNAFVLFFARIIASVVSSQFKDGRQAIYFILYIVLQIAFSVLGSIVVCYFSRLREYRADSGGARYSSRENMISALQALSRQTAFAHSNAGEEDNMAMFKISSRPKKGGFMNLLRTHPPLEERIARLQRGY